MQASSLQLDSSAITRIRLEANKAYPKELASQKFDLFGEAGLESSVEVGVDAEVATRHFVKLGIRMLGTETVHPPYALDIEIVGIFNCELNEAENRGSLVQVNGPAVLYGSIRELVMQLTSRGPFPPLVLPTVNFVGPEVECGPDGRLLKGKS